MGFCIFDWNLSRYIPKSDPIHFPRDSFGTRSATTNGFCFGFYFMLQERKEKEIDMLIRVLIRSNVNVAKVLSKVN